ncbi:MAG: hypothetical protein NWQ24_13280 [Haliea sp.]|nr:hypothetical protein [Haliea sp.]
MANNDSTTLTDRQQYWLKHLRACDASGQTTIDYAKAHGISVKSMYSARKGLAEKATLPRPQPSRFQKAQVVNDPHPQDGQWQVQLPNGAVVAFSGTVDASTLSLVLNTAATLP